MFTNIKDIDIHIISCINNFTVLNQLLPTSKYIYQITSFVFNNLKEITHDDMYDYRDKGKMNDVLGLKYLVKFCGTENISFALVEVAENGRLDLVKYLVSKGADDYNSALGYASCGNHKNIIHYLFSVGAYDLDFALACASSRHHMDLIEYFINHGANNWDWALCYSAGSGYVDLIDFFFRKGATDIEKAKSFAKRNGRENIVEYLNNYILV